jgi:hypothetical protein
MAIKDLLWACPICSRIEAIDGDGRCRSCGTSFSRGRGSRIRASQAGRTEEKHPAEWIAALPYQELDGEGRSLPGGLEPPFTQPARVRLAYAEQALHRHGELLGFVEQFGPKMQGTLQLTETELSFLPASGTGWSWQLTDITAIQPASSSIQVRARNRQVASMRFPAGSLRLWEQRLQYGVRQAYDRAGKGTVCEFQPHIRTR